MTTKILSVGGSIIAPNNIDVDFISRFVKMACEWISENEERRLIFVAGGGAPARAYQIAYRTIAKKLQTASDNNAADRIGIMATRLNAELLKAACGELCKNEVIYNPMLPVQFNGKILVASGWKPGFSTDNDAVLLAEKFNAGTVVNLSNIEKVYTDDPKKNPEAKPIEKISWDEFCKMIGSEWTPGKNTPFDPVASARARALHLRVICTSGKNIENIRAVLNDEPFIGTTIE